MTIPFQSCVHTHTHFCDGKDAPEALVLEALDRGFVSLGFSGHGWAEYDTAAMTPEHEEQYRREIRRLFAGDRAACENSCLTAAAHFLHYRKDLVALTCESSFL